MAREIYISYDRKSDLWRAHVFVQQVRRLFRPRINIARTDWDKYETATAEIRELLMNTVVTVVLIGSETAERPWISFELKQSIERGNGIFGIYIHGMQDHNGGLCHRGRRPLDDEGFDYPAYDWDQNHCCPKQREIEKPLLNSLNLRG